MTSPASFRARLRVPAALGTSVALLLAGGSLLGACGLSDGIDDLFASAGGTGGGSSSTTGSGIGGTTTSSTTSSSVTTTSSTSSTSSSGTAGGSGTGGDMHPGEDCLDGADNDGDGLVDCADPDCNAGFECVSPVPGGWGGYYRVHEAPFPEAAPAPCPPGTEAGIPLFVGPAGAPACNACACGDLTGASCTAAALTCWSGSSSCNNNNDNDWTAALADGNCHKPDNLLGFNNQLSCKLDGQSQLAAPGSCPPSGGDFPNKAAWEKQVDICSSVQTGKGCSNGDACVPRGTNDPGESLCVQKNGQKNCPDGWKTTSIQAFTGGTDSRGCTACSCKDPATTCGPTSYVFHDGNGCGDIDPPIPVDSGSCANISSLLDSFSWSAKASLPKPSGSCEPSGGAPMGSVQTDGPVTFCCK